MTTLPGVMALPEIAFATLLLVALGLALSYKHQARKGHAGRLLIHAWRLSYLLPFPQWLRVWLLRAFNDSFLVGVLGIVRSENQRRFLLAQHTYPLGLRHECWGLPGGSILFGEALNAGLAREIHQELGLEVAVGQLLAVDLSQPPRLDFVFECAVTGGILRPSSEVLRAVYVAYDELPDSTSTRHRIILAELLQGPEHLHLPILLPMSNGVPPVIIRPRGWHI